MENLTSALKKAFIDHLLSKSHILDEPFITYLSGRKFSRRQMAAEIENETEIGVHQLSMIINLSADIMSRNKAVTWEEHERLQATAEMYKERCKRHVKTALHVSAQCKKLRAENAELRNLLAAAKPYVDMVNEDNHDEPEVGLFKDWDLAGVVEGINAILKTPQ